MKQLVPWLWILAAAVIFWLMMIRPAQRRQAAALEMQRSVDVGDEIVLTSGVYGTVRELADDHIKVEVAEGVELRVMRGAVASKVHHEADEAPSLEHDQPSEPFEQPADDHDTHTTGAQRADGED